MPTMRMSAFRVGWEGRGASTEIRGVRLSDGTRRDVNAPSSPRSATLGNEIEHFGCRLRFAHVTVDPQRQRASRHPRQ